ncbi:MAG: hypothetical protein KGL39_05410 [Patescibacteria group bacterium]|nr:hypothetical protein [Patescibacteria group bacterium]
MARQYVEERRFNYSPAAVGTGETHHLLTIKKGDRILWGDVLVRVSAAAGSSTTIALQLSSGAGGAAGGLLAATSTIQTAGAIITLNGSDLAASGGIIATADGTLDAVYAVTTAGATDPVWEITVAIVRREQIH